MASLSPILNNLDAEDLAVKLFAILRLQELTGSEAVPEKLRAAADKETDPALKLYLNWLAYPENTSNDVKPAELAKMLNDPRADWPRILRLLLQASRQTAPQIIAVLRQASLDSLPGNLLPVLVGFYNRFGDSQDVTLLESWCSNTNPAVTILAVEGLSRIQPDRLRNFLFPLLTSESAGIRSRAIRLLYRWHPEEALRQLISMLESDVIDERRAALANAIFLPYDLIKQDLIRFIIRESEPALLVQAGQLLIINPDLDVAKAVAAVAAASPPEKIPVLKGILDQQCEFLARIKLINEAHEAYASRLLSEASETADLQRLASLNAAIRAGQLQNETDLRQAESLLKLKFSLNLPPQSLLPVVESLALLDPAFLQPHLPELLQISDFAIQIAALSAMAKTSPVMAEKVLEQYLCSASPQRRKTGIKVLSRLDPAFARPLLLRTLAQENERELLDQIELQLREPLPRAALIQLCRQARLTDECSERQNLLNRLCQAAGMTAQEATDTGETCDFSQEAIMLGRAEKSVAGAPQTVTTKTSTSESLADARQRTRFIEQYQSLPAFAKIHQIIEAIGNCRLASEESKELLQSETGELQRFALQCSLVAIEQQSRRSFSPAQTLKHNLSRPVPEWIEIAACLAQMTPEAARLTAPMLQQLRWPSWPETVLPFMLRFIGLTTKPAFSASATRFLRHTRPEIRCAAISCLHAINPGDLAESLPSLAAEKDPEVAALARRTARELKAQPLMNGAAANIGKGIQKFAASLQQLSTVSQAALASIMVLALSIFLLANQPVTDFSTAAAESPAAGSNSQTGGNTAVIHRFEHWRQPAEVGQERVIFGRIEENFSDSLLVQSPALNMPVLIRHDHGVLPLKKNQHFNGLVKIDNVNASRIESTLLPTVESKR
ncbi:MAG: hypothetical protein CVV42_12090 [Candidatus Riflebacteria bacterium HGW-Riflebacteria-2]|nr:MAG: hypothetical protein CVV42_12090 [Candidatus Riflebacteria bacterium HGW-Riflebacteria-2]